MDFSLAPEEEALQAMLRDFSRKILKRDYQHWDTHGEFPRRHWEALGELGVLGVSMPEQYGGGGASSVAAGIAVEEVSRGDVNLGYSIVLNSLIGDILVREAAASLLQEWLPTMFDGTRLAAIGVTEPQGGSDVSSIRTEARPNPEGGLELVGEKSGISLAAVADSAVVAVRESADVSLYAVSLHSSGVRRVPFDDLGNRPIGRGSLFFDHVPLREEQRIGPSGGGLRSVLTGFDFSRVLIALQCVGAAEESLDEAIAYAQSRTAFGRSLAEFQGVSFTLARRYAELEQLRWYCYRTLWLRDQGRSHATEAAICKWKGPQVALAAIHDCLILHGQYGYTRDLPLQQRLRDVMGLEIGDGTANIQQMIIGQSLTGVRPR